MKNQFILKASRKMTAYAFAFAMFACCVTVSIAQPIVNMPNPSCFGVILNGSANPCSGNCYNDGSSCDNCYSFKLLENSCSSGLSLDAWKIWVEDGSPDHAPECFSVCSTTTGDFDVLGDYYPGVDHNHVRCDQQPKWPVWQYPGGNAITTTHPGIITICAPPGSVVHIQLVHHAVAGTPCVQPCPEVTISF